MGSSNDSRAPTPTGSPATDSVFAIFYTKAHHRLLRPPLAANAPPAPVELRTALRTIDRHVCGYIDAARLGNAARELKINLKGCSTKER